MLYIKTELRPSPIHGLGLFAAEPIAEKTLVFRWETRFGWVCSVGSYPNLPKTAQEFLKRYGWRYIKNSHARYWLLDLDDSRFVNHSATPNMIVTTKGEPFCNSKFPIESRAARDIAAGEELTEDYRQFDPDFDSYGLEWK